jgi:hypothetical protein
VVSQLTGLHLFINPIFFLVVPRLSSQQTRPAELPVVLGFVCWVFSLVDDDESNGPKPGCQYTSGAVSLNFSTSWRRLLTRVFLNHGILLPL